MHIANDLTREARKLRYEPGLSRVEEPVISSHFMDGLAKDESLRLYNADEFRSLQIEVDPAWVKESLFPLLLREARRFAEQRAALAPRRARQHYERYGVAQPSQIGIEHEITEAIFDRQFVRGRRETCSRQAVAQQIKTHVDAGEAITMVIPALPFKFSSPLKCRGPEPDLGEIDFLLTLFEIVWTVECLYRAARPDLSWARARFIVVSDGGRFNEIVGEPTERLRRYRHGLAGMVDALNVGDRIVLVDYSEVIRDRLPAPMLQAKHRIAAEARRLYAERMWPIFEPGAMDRSLQAAIMVEPDPEVDNPRGRFASLFKSLVFTVKYKSMNAFVGDGIEHNYLALYRDMTAYLLCSCKVPTDFELRSFPDACICGAPRLSHQTRENLRVAMLTEVWQATISYLAEIKSDRDLAVDPISVAFPGCLRWTIHAKAGQLALLTSHMSETPVQCWAGSGALRRTKNGRTKLCTRPALALEGRGARPVVVAEKRSATAPPLQPLFYLDPSLPVRDTGTLVADLEKNLSRLRAD